MPKLPSATKNEKISESPKHLRKQSSPVNTSRISPRNGSTTDKSLKSQIIALKQQLAHQEDDNYILVDRMAAVELILVQKDDKITDLFR